jgi:DNA invertase Pin-like site-specific DNA recombinase
MPLFGYARVSTRDQDLAAQDAELMAAGCAKVFKENVSGAMTDRPELAKAIGRLEPGDVLVVTRLDRFPRAACATCSTRSASGAGFKSLKDAWADTAQRTGALLRAKRWLDVARSYAVEAATITAGCQPFRARRG